MGVTQIASLVGKPKEYIRSLLEQPVPSTSSRVLAKPGRREKTDATEYEIIRKLALAHPFAGCATLADLYNSTVTSDDKKISKASMHRRLGAIGLRIVKLSVTQATALKKKHPNSKFVYKFELLSPEKGEGCKGATGENPPSAPSG